jgi:hypothetical protein
MTSHIKSLLYENNITTVNACIYKYFTNITGLIKLQLLQPIYSIDNIKQQEIFQCRLYCILCRYLLAILNWSSDTILSRIRGVTIDGYRLVSEFIGHLYTPMETTINYSAIANLYNSRITTAPAKPFPSLLYLHQPFPCNFFSSGDPDASRPRVRTSRPPLQDSSLNYQLT